MTRLGGQNSRMRSSSRDLIELFLPVLKSGTPSPGLIGWQSGQSMTGIFPASGIHLSTHLPRWPLWGSVMNSRRTGEYFVPLNLLSLPFPPFFLYFGTSKCAFWLRGKCNSKVNSSTCGHKCFCPTCAGSDLIRCCMALREYGTWLRFIGLGHSWISHSTSWFTPNLCLLVKNSTIFDLNFLSVSICKETPFFLFSYLLYFPNHYSFL